MQFVRLLQYLFAIAKTHNCRQQTTDFNILFQRIAMRELHRITYNKVCTMINLRTHQKFILYIFSHFEKVSSIESTKVHILVEFPL